MTELIIFVIYQRQMHEEINKKGKGVYQVQIVVASFKQDGLNVIYSPSLQLCSYGNTPKEAKANFNSTVKVFLQFEESKNRLMVTLKKLGWNKQASQLKPKKETVHIPYYLLDNLLGSSGSSPSIKFTERSVNIPVSAPIY